MLPERKIIKAIITAKFPVNMVASVLEYLERGYGINWNNRNEVAVDTYRYSGGTGCLQEGLLIVELSDWLIERCRGVLEKLTGPQMIKKFRRIFEYSLPPLPEPSPPPVSDLSQISPHITKGLFNVFCNLMSDGTQKHKKTFPSEPWLLARSRQKWTCDCLLEHFV